ncbi:MAG: hypothetical protein ACTSVU_03035 [Promethearchaeota archaeon]
MSTQKYQAIYKVYFKGMGNEQSGSEANRNLTFFSIYDRAMLLPSFQKFLLQYNDLSRKKNLEIRSIANIKEILTYGNSTKTNFTQFFVLLYSPKATGNTSRNKSKNKGSNPENRIAGRRGFLIGNHKEHGFLCIGVWPFDFAESDDVSLKTIESVMDEIIAHPKQFQDVLLIS